MCNLKLLQIVFISILLFLQSGFVSSEENYPQRIISLSPAIAEEFYILGVEDKLVGCTVYCQRPPQIKTKEKVGTAIEVNLEKVVSLKPDLVLAISLTNPKIINKMKDLGIKVISFSSPKNFTEICEQFLKLGKIIAKDEQAEEIIRQAKNNVDLIKKNTKDLPKPKVFVQIGARPLYAVTKDSFINDLIEFAGGINVAAQAQSGLYSREEAIRQNPDIIIIVTMGIVGEGEKEIWKKYKTLNATKNDRIFIVDSYKLCNPTPVSFVETLKEMVEILHFKKGGKTLWLD